MNHRSSNRAYLSGILHRWLSLAWAVACLVITENTRAEELSAAIAARKVSVSFSGTGGSSGDSVMATVKLTDKSAESLHLTISPGTRLRSGNSSAQNMVVAGVKGEMTGSQSYRGTSTITATSTPATYVLEAYCAEFEKDNPGSSTHFSVGSVDPVLACILEGASNLSVSARQAAVWIYTDKASYNHVNQKFSVSRSDWDAAAAVVRNCLSRPKGSEPPATDHKSAEHKGSSPPDTSLPSDMEIAAAAAASDKHFALDSNGRVIPRPKPLLGGVTFPASTATPPPNATPPPAEVSPATRSGRIRIGGNGLPIVAGAAQASAPPSTPHAAEESSSGRPVRVRIDGSGRRIVDGAAQAPAAAVTPSAEASAGTRPVRLRIDGNGRRVVDGAAQPPAASVTPPEKAPADKPSGDSTPASPEAAAPAKPSATAPDSKKSPDETAWEQTDKVSDESLQKYLTQFPEGKHAKDAGTFLALAKQVQSIAAGTIKPGVVIPFEALGKQWRVAGAKEGVAFSYNRTEKKDAMTGAFWRSPSLDYEGVRSGARGTFSDQFYSRWPENAPTGNGSIIAFDTQGEECPLRAAPVIVSDKGSIVYFGVVEKIGLVHLSGKGRVILADGTTKNLE